MQIIITTQYRENYGAHDWNGEGECPQYWKNKGGDQYVLTDVKVTDNFEELVKAAMRQHKLSFSSNYSEQFVLDWEITEDGALTADEKWEVGYYGKVELPAKRFSANDLLQAA
jgi:hypothetical protein